jgi:hypothetical protein
MQKPISIDLDTTNDESVIQYENIRKGDTLLMTFNLFQGSVSLNLTGQSMHIVLQKSDGYAVEKIVNSVTGNNFQVAFDLQATLSVGDVIGIIEISDVNGTDISNTFTFEVKENPSSSIVINSKNEIETLSQITALINNYNNNADYLKQQNDLATQNIATLETDNTNGVNTAVRLEKDIVDGTATAVRLEGDITTGNALDLTLKDDITTGNQTDNNLKISITNGNQVVTELQNVDWVKIKSFMDLMEIVMNGMPLTDENAVELTDENGQVLTL